MNNNEGQEIFMKGVARTMALVFAIICIGIAIIPYMVAKNTGRWEFMLIYPGVMFMLLIAAAFSGRKKKND